MPGKLKTHVDQDKCQGHARCKSLAPELFEFDEYGNARGVALSVSNQFVDQFVADRAKPGFQLLHRIGRERRQQELQLPMLFERAA